MRLVTSNRILHINQPLKCEYGVCLFFFNESFYMLFHLYCLYCLWFFSGVFNWRCVVNTLCEWFCWVSFGFVFIFLLNDCCQQNVVYFVEKKKTVRFYKKFQNYVDFVSYFRYYEKNVFESANLMCVIWKFKFYRNTVSFPIN